MFTTFPNLLGTNRVAREVDERWRAVRTAFDRLCFMYVDAMSAQSEPDAT